MASNFRPSAACCTTPRIVGPPYAPKGKFVEMDGTKVYVSGPDDATKAIFVLYDIFGYSGQILQGVDRLAKQYRIFMPGFFGDGPAPLAWKPMDGPDDDDKLNEFCDGPGETQKSLRRMSELRQKFQETEPRIEKWGLLGYCWGGFVANYAIGKDSPFSACVICHPGFPEAEIASQISVPLLALCSKEEPEAEFKHFKPALKVEHHFEMFLDQEHGFMSARADLAKSEVQAEFDRAYGMVLDWFHEHM